MTRAQEQKRAKRASRSHPMRSSLPPQTKLERQRNALMVFMALAELRARSDVRTPDDARTMQIVRRRILRQYESERRGPYEMRLARAGLFAALQVEREMVEDARRGEGRP